MLVMVLFALSNPQPVPFTLWPTDYSVQLPLSLAVLGAMGVAFVFGALVLWTTVLATRYRARRAERTVRMLEAQVAELKAGLEGLKAAQRAAAMSAPAPGRTLVLAEQ